MFHMMQKSVDGFTERVIREDGSSSKGLSSIIFGRKIASVRDSSKLAASTVIERGWKSEEIKASLIHGRDIETNKVRHLKKSQSHGDELYMDGRIGTENETDDGTDRITSPNSLEPNGILAAGHSKRVDGSPDLYQKRPLNSVSAYHGSDQALNGSIFSVGDHADKDSLQVADSSLSSERMDNSDSHTPHSSPQMVKSNSMPNIADSESGRSSPFKYSSHHSRSSDDLRALNIRQTEKFVHETDVEVKQDQDYGTYKSGENSKENVVEDGYDYSSLAKDWIVPATDELKSRKFLKGETSNQQSEFPGHDFKIKRIEDWVNDLQHVNLSEEADEFTGYDDEIPKEPTVLNEPTASKGDVKLTPGMEAAKKYISSLSASATTAQLVSHGLVVIPFLSAFVGLKVLNLSGNAIGCTTMLLILAYLIH